MFCSRCGSQIGMLPCPDCGHGATTDPARDQADNSSSNMWDAAASEKVALVVYGLLALGVALSWLGGVGFIFYLIGGALAWVACSRTDDPMLLSHFRWQIRTFVFGFIWGLVAVIAIVTIIGILLGIPIAIAAGVWIIYRIVKGFTMLLSKTSMYPNAASAAGPFLPTR
jgi:uncharacterized membrane protein